MPQDATTSCAIDLASNDAWSVYTDESLAVLLGPAHPVCITSTHPSNCPSNATIYGGDTTSWTADIAAFDGGVWIWRPDVTPTTPSDFARAVFVRSFDLAAPATGTLTIAADDFARVLVNGVEIGTVGSTTSSTAASDAESFPTTFTLTKGLVVGSNTLVVSVQNGPATFAIGCAGPCTYAVNHAGVILGGAIRCK